MWVHPQFDPVALQLGPIAIHWYGLTYLLAFGLFFFLMRRRMALPSLQAQGWLAKDLDDILFLGVMGVILGGRLGYVLFYKPDVYLANPALILKVWEGGMSFHGGLLGVIAALAWFAYSRKRPFWQVTDIVAPCVPTGIFAVRMGNFINGELFGRVAGPDVPWAMVFRGGGPLARHPSQIYQALAEGLLLFALLWWFARKPRPLGQVSGLFLAGYGVMRFMVEFFREPDDFLGLRWLQLSQGQWLCLPMVLAGIAIMVWSQRRGARA